MPKPTPLAVIEVGTTQAVCLIGMPQPDGCADILGAGVNPLVGLRKGQIQNMPDAVTGVRTAIAKAEKAAGMTIPEAWLVISGGNVQADILSGTVYNEAPTVSAEDLTNAVEIASATSRKSLPERAILHLVPQNYVVDDRHSVASPAGLPGRKVDARVLTIHADASVVGSAQQLLQEAHLPVKGRLFSAVCDAATLSEDDRRNGTLVVNLGGGTTSFAVYSEGIVTAAGSIPVGGDHVTNDLAHAFRISFKTAEELKVSVASAVVSADMLDKRVRVPDASRMADERSVNLHDLCTVVNARVEELLGVVAAAVGDAFYSGVVLFGGGALLRGAETIAQRVFNCPCRLGSLPDGVSLPGLAPPVAATTYGAFRVAARELAEQEASASPQGLWNRLFGKPKGDIR